MPRDRNGAFEPQLIRKGQTRFNAECRRGMHPTPNLLGFDDKILALYARGMTTRDIQAQLQELYGMEVSHSLISNVTEAVEAERKLCGVSAWDASHAEPPWQNRSLDPVYPTVYLDALVVKVRQDGRVINKAIHLDPVD